MALLADIDEVTGEGSPCSILEVPLNALRSAGNSLQGLRDNPPAGIRQLANQMRSLEIPNIDRTGELAAGIRSIREQLPTDASELTSQLSDAIHEFFDGLQEDIAESLGGAMDGFGNVGGLSNIGAPTTPEQGTDALTSISNLRNSLDNLPNPITVETLLQFLHDGLLEFPRKIVPLRYLPIIDELRDKLSTALAWKQMTGEELAAHLAGTLDALSAAITRNFLEGGPGAIAGEITRLGNLIDDTALTNGMTDMVTGLNSLKTAVESGNLSGTGPNIALVSERLSTLRVALSTIDGQILQGQGNALNTAFAQLGPHMDDRALQFLAMINPPQDLDILGFLLGQVNTLLENTGIANLIAKIGEFLGSIREVLQSLNIVAIKDTIVAVVATAKAAVDGLRQTLIRMTIEFSAVMDRVKDAIRSLGISDLVEAMENGIRNFQRTVRAAVDTLFAPVRNFLLGIFNTLNGYLEQMDPSVIVQTLRNIISRFTDLLSNPQLLDALDTVKSALDSVNEELGSFSFKPGTDVVVQAIGVVETALGIASSLPLPDSLKRELRDALNRLPRSIDPAVEILTDGLHEIIEEGPIPVLNVLKDGPKKVVDIVSQYSPDKLVNECLGRKYEEFLEVMQAFKPSSLLAPIQTALDELKDALSDAIDPGKLLDPLQAPFDELLLLLDSIDPSFIISPINDLLQDSVQTIVQILPLGEVNEIFDQIAAVAEKIEYAFDVLHQTRLLMEDIRDHLAGLQNAEQQLADFGTEVANALDGLSDITPVTTAMNGVGAALAGIHSAGLQAAINPSVAAMRARLTALNAKTKLTQLAAAKQAFPRSALDQIVGFATEKLLIQNLLDSFNPVQAEFTAPVDFLDTWGAALETRRVAFVAAVQTWDSRILNPQGPLMQLHQPALTTQDLKTLLSTAITEQLTSSLTPIFRAIDHFQVAVDGLVVQISGFLGDVEVIVNGILDITDALEQLRDSINELVDTLVNLDLNFIVVEIQEVFDVLRDELMALSPSRIADILKKALDDLLDILDLEALLGADSLDGAYLNLLNTLKRFDPGKLIVEVLQPEFDKVIEFLKRFDMSVQIEAFIANIGRLEGDLKTELERCGDAYEKMWDAIPSNIGTVTGRATVSITA